MLAAVILSAGASSRMGRPKALLPYFGTTFLGHLIAITRHPAIGVTRVVLGAEAGEIQRLANLDPLAVVLNPDWERGQLSSIQAGVHSLAGLETEGMLLCPIDHPLVSAELIDQLISRFDAHRDSNPRRIVLPTFCGRRGHPLIFSSALYNELLGAPADQGARAVVWAHEKDVLEVPTESEGVVLNINDPGTLRRAIPNFAE